MADDYIPTFEHDPWQDNVDLVVAEGDDGVNKRFDDIKKEFDKIAKIVNDLNNSIKQLPAINNSLTQLPAINSRLDKLSTDIASLRPDSITLAFAPFLQFTSKSDSGAQPWDYLAPSLGAVAGSASNTRTSGWLPVQLPSGYLIKEVQVDCGIRAGNEKTFFIGLYRQLKSLASGTGPSERLFSKGFVGPSATPSPNLFPLDGAIRTEGVDNESYAYYIYAMTDGNPGQVDLIGIWISLVLPTEGRLVVPRGIIRTERPLGG